MNTEALERIETKITFLERANFELSDVVFRQQRDLEALRGEIAALAARVRASGESEITQRMPEDERPPHY